MIPEESDGYALQHIGKEYPEQKRIYLIENYEIPHHYDPAYFYQQCLKHNNHTDVIISNDIRDVQVSDTILTRQTEIITMLNTSFLLEEIHNYKGCKMFLVQSK